MYGKLVYCTFGELVWLLKDRLAYYAFMKLVYYGFIKLVYCNFIKLVFCGFMKLVYCRCIKLVYCGFIKLVYCGWTMLDAQLQNWVCYVVNNLMQRRAGAFIARIMTDDVLTYSIRNMELVWNIIGSGTRTWRNQNRLFSDQTMTKNESVADKRLDESIDNAAVMLGWWNI